MNLKLNDMKKLLLLCVFCMGGVLSGRSQDVIFLHKDNPLAGRVLWEKSKGDSLFYRSAVSSGDSLLLFVPRRRVEYVLSDGDRRMLYRGKTRGWPPWRVQRGTTASDALCRVVEYDSRRLVGRCVGDADDESQ